MAVRRRAQDGLLIAGGAALTSLLAYVLMQRGIKAALAVVVLFPVGWFVIRRPARAFPLALTVVLVLPYWWTLGSGQATVIRVGVLLAALAALLAPKVPLTTLDYVLAAYVIAVAGCWWLEYDHPEAGHIVTSGLSPIVFYLAARGMSRAQIPKVMLTVLAAGTVGALTVLFEFAVGHVVFLDPTQYVWNASDVSIFRPGGIFGSPPSAATILAFVVLYGAAAVPDLRGRQRRLGFAALGLCALALVVTFTRTDLIGVGAGLLVFLSLTRARVMRLIPLLAIVVGLTAALIVALPALEKTTTFQEAIVRPGNLTARESYWSLALPIAESSVHNMVVGVGTGVLEAPFLSANAPLPASVAIAPQLYLLELHNQYLTTLVEQGLLGLLPLVLLLVIGGWRALSASLHTQDRYYAALAGCIVCMAIVFLANSAMNDGPTVVMLMTSLGLTVSAGAKSNRDRARSAPLA